MVELAVRDGWTPPADLPRGECIVTSLPHGGIRIDQADPRVLISGEVLDSIAGGDKHPDVALNTTGCMPPPWRATYVGAVLKINAINEQVIYNLTEYVPAVHGYIGQWPD